MKSGFENYLIAKLNKNLTALRKRDRAVVIGGILSFVPVFPAVLLGFLLSCLNYFLISKGITEKKELGYVRVSLFVSGILSSIWVLLIFAYAHSVFDFLVLVIELPLELFREFLKITPANREYKV